jgi:S1-C subfamily serine protease
MRYQHGMGHVVAVVLVAIVLAVSLVAISDQMNTAREPRLNAARIANGAAPGIVSVEATMPDGSNVIATGLVLTSSGDVLTNDHLIPGAAALTVAVDSRRYAATVRGYDISNDVALLALTNASRLATINLADSSTVAAGTPVVAVGRAVDSAHELTADAGRVTALHQRVDAYAEHLADMIAVDIPTRPSDSGGAILDKNGNVIALITAAPSGARFRQQTSATTSFAIPINTVVAIADHIDAGRSAGTVHVGATSTLGAAINADGIVAHVDPAGPAARAGIGPGAIIVAINYKNVATQTDVSTALVPYQPGDEVHVDWAGTNGVFHSSVVTLTG